MSTIELASAENIAKRLNWFIKFLGLKQNKFAKSIDVLPSQLNNWLRARDPISSNGAIKISYIYGLSLDFILLGRLNALTPEMRESFIEFEEEHANSKDLDLESSA